jgi:glycerol-3-phosphate dehydrogenase (NAD(P)+)
MQRARTNTAYLPGAEFPASLQACVELGRALEGATDILIAVPSHAFRSTLTMVLEHGLNDRRVVWATKGFELESGLLPHQVAAELIGSSVSTAVLSGPTFATEVAAGLPSALTIASTDAAFAHDVAEMIATETFRAYTSADVIGVEVGGATKNVYAIGAGISDGLGFGANTRIALVTRGLAEMTRLGRKLGARQETFMGLAGMGDLVLTCTDDLSRNRRFGKALASGIPAPAALREIGQVVEGYYGARAVRQVARRMEVEMPIVEQVYEVLYEALSPRLAVANLMSRPIMAENT